MTSSARLAGGALALFPSQWCHNGRVSNPQPHHCLLNRWSRCSSKKTSKSCVTGLCAGKSPVPAEFPAQIASNAENVSIWWHHHYIQFTGDAESTDIDVFRKNEWAPPDNHHTNIIIMTWEEGHGVSHHRQLDYLLSHLCRPTAKKHLYQWPSVMGIHGRILLTK